MTEPTITVEEQIAFIHGEAAVWLSKSDAAPRSARKPFFQEAEKFEAVEATLRRVALLEKVAEAARAREVEDVKFDAAPDPQMRGTYIAMMMRRVDARNVLQHALAALDAASGKEQK